MITLEELAALPSDYDAALAAMVKLFPRLQEAFPRLSVDPDLEDGAPEVVLRHGAFILSLPRSQLEPRQRALLVAVSLVMWTPAAPETRTADSDSILTSHPEFAQNLGLTSEDLTVVDSIDKLVQEYGIELRAEDIKSHRCEPFFRLSACYFKATALEYGTPTPELDEYLDDLR